MESCRWIKLYEMYQSNSHSVIHDYLSIESQGWGMPSFWKNDD